MVERSFRKAEVEGSTPSIGCNTIRVNNERLFVITFHCISCQQSIDIPNEYPGKDCECPNCSKVNSVPNSGQTANTLSLEQALDTAFSHYSLGNFSASEQLCRDILAKAPDQIDAMQLLGVFLNQKGQYTEAADILSQAVKQMPDHPQLHNNLGMAVAGLGKPEEAISHFKKAIVIRPDFAKAHNNLGVTTMKLGRLDEAAEAFGKAVEIQGDFKQAYNNLGLVLKKKGQLEKAVTSYEKALSIDSEYTEALSNLSMAMIDQGKLNEAESNLQKAVNLVPDSAEFWNNLGVLFNRQGRFEQAVTASEKAIAERTDYLEAHNNLGTALMELSQFAEANAAFEKAIAIDPESAQPHHNRSLVLLLTEQFEQGWQEYEWRWSNEGFSTPARPFPQKRWDGSAENVGKLLVWGEQGIGDEVQFSGLIRDIISRDIDVIVECDQRLTPLLQRSFPQITVVDRSDRPFALLKDPSITHQIPMASIPGILGLSPNSMDFQKPFLIPDEKLRDQLRRKYKANENILLAGISWKSGNSQEGRKRSVDLEHWEPIFNVGQVRFVSLQYGECSKALQTAHNQFGVDIIKDENINPLTDLEGFAAQVAAMDVVISVDNSTVHFAGVMGVNTWIMLPTVPDWRWGLEAQTTRWYRTMKLFRQEKNQNWQPVISNVTAQLTHLANEAMKL